MSSILLTPPETEPLTLDEAKAFLRVDTSDEDLLITTLIKSARLHVESRTLLALITQNWRMVLDCWPAHGRIAVRPGPLRAVTAARVYDFDGHVRAVDSQAFVADTGAAVLAFVPWAMPMPTRIAAGIEIDITVGFGDAATDVPEPLRQAIRLLVVHWYENRGIVAADGRAMVPATVAALTAPYRMVSL